MSGREVLILCLCVGCPFAFVVIGGIYSEYKYNATADRTERQATFSQAGGCDNSGGE